MRETPRHRRLRSDFRAIVQLRDESTILDFSPYGNPPEAYLIRFHGRGLWKPENSSEILGSSTHEVSISFGANYPRQIPDMTWRSPIYHPNISASGVVCLGGYGTHWVPAVGLDDLCLMLWDMIRYQNYDIESPYNREAAAWVRTQTTYRFPVDERPLRDKLARQTPYERAQEGGSPAANDVVFLGDQSSGIVEAEVLDSDDNDILFIE